MPSDSRASRTPPSPSASPTSVGRLAPSPTGLLHLGHARSFLLAWWHARSRGGRIVLRMEDLDAERLKLGMTEAALRDLEWLGLDWDGEMVLQSIGAERFDVCVRGLIEKGMAYPCVCTRAEIAASQSAPHGESAGASRPRAKETSAASSFGGSNAPGPSNSPTPTNAPASAQAPPSAHSAGSAYAPGSPSASAPANPPTAETRYPGTCRGRFASIEDAERASGRSPCVRLIARPGTVRIEDGCAGAFDCDVAAEVGDFPIARKAGAAAYQLAVVVDDARMGVNEVVRGEDLLSSAARQFLVQEALGLPHPRWWHVPLVVDEGGKRLAKRTDAVAIAKFRERGVDPREIVAWVARGSGVEVEGRVTAREVAGAFEMGKVPRNAVVCGEKELGEIGFGST